MDNEKEERRRNKDLAETPAEKFTREMRFIMRKRLVVDIFTLVGLVLKERVGSVRLHDKAFDTMFRHKQLQITVMSWVGIPITLLMTALMTTSRSTRRPDGSVALTMDEAFEDNMTRVALILAQIMLTGTSLATCVMLVQKYQLVVYEKRRLWSGYGTYDLVQHQQEAIQRKFEESYSFWRSGIRWRLLGEILVHLLHPFIILNNPPTETLFSVLQGLVFVRLYSAIRLMFLFSEAFQARFDVVASNQELQRTGFQVRARSTMVIIYYRYPILISMLMAAVVLLPFGFFVYLCERDEQKDPVRGFGRLESGYWFAFCTFSTVGFGDIVPTTVLGRLCAIILSALGVTVRTIVGGIVTNLMVQSKEQRHVSEYLKIVRNSKGCRHAAARAIQACWRHYRQTRGHVVVSSKWRKIGHKSNNVCATIKEFKAYRWRLSQSQSTANDPVVDAKINSVTVGLAKMVSEQHPVGLLVAHEEAMVGTFNAIDTFMNEVDLLLGAR